MMNKTDASIDWPEGTTTLSFESETILIEPNDGENVCCHYICSHWSTSELAKPRLWQRERAMITTWKGERERHPKHTRGMLFGLS